MVHIDKSNITADTLVKDCWNFLHAETCMQGNFYNTNLEISLNVWWLILLLQDYTTVSTIEIGMKNCSA